MGEETVDPETGVPVVLPEVVLQGSSARRHARRGVVVDEHVRVASRHGVLDPVRRWRIEDRPAELARLVEDGRRAGEDLVKVLRVHRESLVPVDDGRLDNRGTVREGEWRAAERGDVHEEEVASCEGVSEGLGRERRQEKRAHLLQHIGMLC